MNLIALRIEDELDKKLTALAEKNGTTKSALIRKAVDLFLHREDYLACAGSAIESAKKFQELVALK